MNSTVKVGIFMFVALILAGLLILKIEDLPFGKSTAVRRVEALFDTVAGLDDKSAVRVAGIRVGRVDSILLEGNQARTILRIDDPRVVLHDDAKARVVAMGLLGDKYVELDPGSADRPVLGEGTVLGGSVTAGIDGVAEIAGDIGKDLKEVSESLKKAMGGVEGEKRVFEIVENIRDLTASLREILRENQRGVNATVANFESFSGELSREVPRIAEQIRILSEKLNAVLDENRDPLKDGIGNVRDVAAKLEISADNLNSITGKIDQGDGTLAKLVNSGEAHDKLTKALDNVSEGVETLTKTLGKIGTTRFDLGFEGTYHSETERTRSAFTFDVTPKDSKRFYKVDVVMLPDGKRKEKTESITTILPDGTSETVVIKKTKWDDGFGFTANVGYRPFEELSLRAGLIEGEGGVAADYDALGRKLRLSVEAFDFSRKDELNDEDADRAVHLRLTGRWRLNDHLFLTGGYDDPLLKVNRSVFFGGGVTWVDEDIKYLMGSVPIP